MFLTLTTDLILIFLASFLTGLILISLFKRFSEKTGMFLDTAEGDILKIHTKKTSLLGGAAIVISVFSSLFFLDQQLILKIAGFFAGLIVIFLTLVIDDLKWKHGSRSKPILKAIMLVSGAAISAFILFFSGIFFSFFPLAVLAIFFNFIYIFLSINSVNYQDGMDGLAGGLVLISLIGFFVLSLLSGNNLGLIISLSSMGAVLAFLFFNFPPAKIFMGDSGAYSLGFILAVLAFIFSKPYNILTVIGPFFVIGIPVFGGIFSNIRRIFLGKSIFLGDRSHFYDKMLSRGFSVKRTLFISCALQIIFVAIGVFLYVYV